MKLQNTERIGIDKLKMLIFGDSGAGKTTLAGTINEPTLIISAEAGLLPLRGKKIDVIDLAFDDNNNLVPKEKRIERLGEAYKYLLLADSRAKYKWIFVDSLSEINQCIMEQLYLEFPEKNQTLPMYGEASKRMRAVVKSFRDLPYNVVLTSLAEIEKDENGYRYMAPQLVGKFSTQVGAYFDELFYLQVIQDEGGELKRILVTSKTDRILAKDRSGVLSKTELADLQLIANKIRGEKK